jgi:hypothetical protein
VLTITPAIDALKIGSTETLAAVVLSGDGTRRTIVPSWSSDAPEVVAVGDDGRVRGVSLGKTTIHASFQALSAVQPMSVVPDYEGTWSGDYRIANCTWISGAGRSPCLVVGAVLPLRTVVTQNGASLSGTLEFYTNTRRLLETGPVEGRIDDSGALVLTGTTSAVDPSEPGETTLSNWKTMLTADGDEMTGRFVRKIRFQNFWGLQETRWDCETVKVTRAAIDGAS